MKKIIIAIVSVIILVCGLIIGNNIMIHQEHIKNYNSITNVFEEISYATQNRPNKLKLLSFEQVIGSSNVRRAGITKIKYPNKYSSNNDQLHLYIGENKTALLEYRAKISEEAFLFITYTYNENVLVEHIIIGFSELSDEYVKLAIEEEKSQTGEMSKEELYRYAGVDYPVKASLTNPTEVLEYLKPYNIDKTWLEKKSHETLYDDFLNIWFEKGSQRYSKDKLGDLKIEKAEIFR